MGGGYSCCKDTRVSTSHFSFHWFERDRLLFPLRTKSLAAWCGLGDPHDFGPYFVDEWQLGGTNFGSRVSWENDLTTKTCLMIQAI